MKCTDVRAALPLLLYGEPSPHDAVLREHLAGCAACLREQQELEAVRRLLHTAPAPEVEVDLPRLYQESTARQTRPLRNWRRVAVVLGAIAAALLLALGLRLEVRLGQGQMVVRWGDPPPAAPALVPTEPIVKNAALPPESAEAELRVLSDLIHALKRDADDREERYQERLDRLQRHVQILQARGDQRWNTTEQDVAALYLLTRQGEKP